MVVETHLRPTRRSIAQRPDLRLVEAKRRHRAQLHLLTYIIGNALFWTLWGALTTSTDYWYWWPIIPIAGWTAVLGIHLWHVFGTPHRRKE